MKTAVYPGTFDPVTHGHMDIIQRGSRVFDELIVVVANNPAKEPLFTVDERVEILRRLIGDLCNTTVDTCDGLMVDYVKHTGANVILRGIRTVSDFEYEFQRALMNRALAPDVETVFVMTSEEHSYYTATLIKEVALSGGKVESFVPEDVAVLLRAKLLGTDEPEG